jgi:hypothetical protein
MRAHILGPDGCIANTIVLDRLEDVPTAIDASSGGQVGDFLNEAGEWETPAAQPPPIPQSVSMRQARLALLSYGLLDDVEAVIITMTEPQRTQTQIEWEYAQTVERDNALVAALGPALGLDDPAIDSLFTLAATL